MARRLAPASLLLGALLCALPAAAQITFYENDGFGGRTFRTDRQVANFMRHGFSDRASSVVVERGRWEVCDDIRFQGSCVVLRPGNYRSLRDLGLNDRLSSVRPAGRGRSESLREPDPADGPAYAYRRRPDERIYQAPVTSVRAVMGEPSERCWVDRDQLPDRGRSDPHVGRGVLGAVIGGVLGHQVGGGSGRDIATVGGAVAGAVIGANSGRDSGGPPRDVRRCETVASTTPAWWDVGYSFRGTPHHLQMNSAPGETISVNSRGEPRQ
jgi:uncharacterized protein YcfJ